MTVGDVVEPAVLAVVVGLVVLAVLWPTPSSAQRLLRRWGVALATDAEVAAALTYLRRRRFCYPWLFLVLGALTAQQGRLSPDGQQSGWSLPAALLGGALLAELLAQRRVPAPLRVAVPVRRSLPDVVPAWALVVHGLAALGTVVVLGSGLLGAGWARSWLAPWSTAGTAWQLAAAVLSVLVAYAVVALAVRRPAVPELRIDPLLRTRSARVAMGLGVALLTSLSVAPGQHIALPAFLIGVAGLVAWSAVAGPDRSTTAARVM